MIKIILLFFTALFSVLAVDEAEEKENDILYALRRIDGIPI